MAKTFQLFLVIFICNNFSGYSIEQNDDTTPNATISGGGTFCQYTGNKIVTFTGSDGVAPYTFTYTINGGSPQTIQTNGNNSSVNLNFSTNNSGTFTYQLISVEDENADDDPDDDNPNGNVSGSVIFNITPAPDNSLGGTGSGTFNGQPVFTACNNQAATFTFTNISSSPSINTNYTINWGDGSPNFTGTNWTSLTHDYDIGIYTLTYTIEGSTGCNTTRNYTVFVGSNPAVSLGNPGNTDICNDQSLTFPITGTDNNTEGTVYTITFNDGSDPIVFNHPPPSSVTHTFLNSSCNTTSSDGSNTYFNSYSANIVASNPCSTSSVGVVPIYVSAVPISDFEFPEEPPCVNTQVCIEDLSTGNSTNGSNVGCTTNPNIIWEISPDTFTISNGVLGNDFGLSDPDLWITGSELLCVNFNSAGTYTITQTVANRCGIDVLTKTICIEPEITPQFNLDFNEGCTPLTVNATNTTDDTLGCKPFEYEWFVTYSSDFCGGEPENWSFINGTDNTSENPSFTFETPGTYNIELVGTNFCTNGSSTQQVIVKKPPELTLDPIDIICDSTIINPTAVVDSCTDDSNTLIYDWQFPGATPSSSNLESPGPIDYGAPGSYTFSLQVSNECGISELITETVIIEENPEITNTDLTQDICSGTSFADINLTSNLTGTSYSWSATATPGISGFTASGNTEVIPGTLISTTNTSPGTITYTVIPSTANCTGSPTDFVITVNPAPEITALPLSSTVCLNGTPNTLSVSTSETNAQYQWYSNTIDSNTGGTIIPGATDPDYIPPTDTVGEIFYYVEIVFTTSGCSTLNSQTASVEVTSGPTITAQPLPLQNLCVGGSISNPLTVNFENGTGTVSYQWFSNTTNSNTGGTAIAGEINLNFNPPPFNIAGNYFYYVELTFGGSGCSGITSNVAEIIVFEDPVIDSQPIITQTLCQNSTPENLEVQVTGGIGAFNYQWFSNTIDSNTGGTLIPGATNAIFTPPTDTIGTFYYYSEITQASPGCSTISDVSEMIINPSPSIDNQPQSQELCLGETANPISVSVINGVGTPSYEWYSNNIDDNTTGTLISGENSNVFTPPVATVGTIYYYVVITFSNGGCSEIISDTAEIIVNETPVISNYFITICSGDVFDITPDASNGDIVPTNTTYTWNPPNVNPTGTIAGTSGENSPQNSISQTLINTTSSASTVSYLVTPTAGICDADPFNVVVTVNPSLEANTSITPISCLGADDGSIATSISGGITFTSGDPYLV
jgi:hypothetical protein